MLTCCIRSNYVSGLIAITLSEGMNIGMSHGVDPKVLSSIFAVSTAGSWVNCTSFCHSAPLMNIDPAHHIVHRSSLQCSMNFLLWVTILRELIHSPQPVPGVCPDAPPSNDYQGGFKVQLMRKDFNLAVEAGSSLPIAPFPFPLSALVRCNRRKADYCGDANSE